MLISNDSTVFVCMPCIFIYVRQNYYPWAINTMEGDSAQKCPGDFLAATSIIHTIQALCIVMLSKISFYDLYICSSRRTCENDPIWHGELVKFSQPPGPGRVTRASHWMPRETFFGAPAASTIPTFFKVTSKKAPKSKENHQNFKLPCQRFWEQELLILQDPCMAFLLMFTIKIQPNESKDIIPMNPMGVGLDISSPWCPPQNRPSALRFSGGFRCWSSSACFDRCRCFWWGKPRGSRGGRCWEGSNTHEIQNSSLRSGNPRKIHMSPRKGLFQKEVSSSKH